MGARPGLPFLSAGAHGRSRQFSVLVTSWGVSCPNGVARDRRETSCAPRDTPPLPGGAAAAGPGARFPSRFRVVPRRGRPFLSHGADGPSRGRCAPRTLRRRPSAGRGGRGPPRSSPGGAPPALNGRLAGRRRHARVMESTSKMYEKRGPRAPCSFFFVFRLQKFRVLGQDPPTAPALRLQPRREQFT